jgi:hypothetical protein
MTQKGARGMSSYSERKGSNNDGMCPDWKPSFPETKMVGDMINDLMLASSHINDALQKIAPLDMSMDYKITMSARLWNEFLIAYGKLK